ncbi:MAG: peptidase [Planctomycetaceae bacterium]|nr:peptidase [Planctomycetaceae bacterium]
MQSTTRRRFLRSAGSAAAVAMLGPCFVHASDKAGTRPARVGEGDYQYACDHHFGQLPDHVQWGDTHGVCIDDEGLIYIKHRSRAKEPMDAIVVFDPAGKFVRSFGKEYHGGGHGIDIRREGSEQFLYLSDVKHGIVARSTLKGEQLWSAGKPVESGKYDDPKARYSPTNIAFSPDGGIYVGDGYGSNYIHHYSAEGKWLSTFGGPGSGEGELKTPHGLWLDDRPGRKASLIVADRANARMQYFSLDGNHQSFLGDVSFPADIDIQGEILLVPDLHARVSLFDGENQLLTHLGYDADWTKRVLDGFKLRTQPENWVDGRFIHPHDACFDSEGNIFVTEWVSTGRVTKLSRIS